MLLMLVYSTASMAASSASGTFTLDGKTYKINSVRAKTDENPFDEKKLDVVVLLTDQAVAGDDFDLVTVNEVADKGTHGIMLSINDQKEVQSMVVLGVTQKSGNSICEFEPGKFDTSIAQGRVYMKEPDESFGHKYNFDIRFDTPVKADTTSANKASGTPLPAGGGEPGKAYMEYDKVARAGDLKGLKKFAADERMAKQLDDPDAPKMIEMMKLMRASDIKIVQGFVNGDDATLIVEGKDPMGGGKSTGTVTMRRVGKDWKLVKESWKSKM
jgi:hypothetical protein